MALTHDEVIDTAVGLLRKHGLADLTMRRLARELDVQPGALYWHVDNKQTLLVRVSERMLAEVTTATTGDPVADIRRLAGDMRNAVLPVPDGADVVALSYALDADSVPAFVRLRHLVGALCDSPAQTSAATDLIVHHVLGSIGTEQDRRSADLPLRGAAATFERGLDLALISITPTAERRSAHGS
ncbi:TetR family transcriptional regulator [Flexivirga endophytica]|uniref:TetR family transcriptional regulator n=1 Tax=Flexivirga endophytica TaxID=1849103 RepID=A0A916WXX4_9MICO|nr:TetR family transcriptional regulator [Flexivirga endophytica]GGB39146.1 TetR family transcriptional regulator [Flexivirga endophytica]GHB47121.1 TetR family transcriptional regulator [Flexivirga endophytica]